MIEKCIAERKLLYSLKDSDIQKEFIIRIGEPYIVDENEVNFSVGEGLVGCDVEVMGLPEKDCYYHEVYGMDGVQALEIATNIEPFLKRLSKKYDIYWTCGESYF